MNLKLFSLFIIAMAFTMIFGTGVIKAAAAKSDSYNYSYSRSDNVGVDEAGNQAGHLDRDRDRDRDRGANYKFQNYGLQGNWQGEH